MQNYPFGSNLTDINSITFLVLSDLHLNSKKLEKLKNWYFSSSTQKLDYLLILGDFDNIPQEKVKGNIEIDKEICAKSEANISNILSFLEFVACPIFYIPGNHDAYTLFLKDPAINPIEHKKLTQNSTNLHLTNFQITKDLQFIGVGGSIPAYKKQKQGFALFYEGFPYQTDEEFEKDLDKIKGMFSEKIQTILLTHNGPEFSSTSVNFNEDPNDPIYFGSMSLFKRLSFKNNVLLNFHGHIHGGVGKSRINDVDVVNPGSLSNGDFCILELVKNSLGNKWIVKSTNFLNLNAFH